MAGSDASSLHTTTSIIRPAFIELWLFSTDSSLVCVHVYHCFHSVLRHCLTILLKLDLQFELQSLPIPLLFCCLLLVGRWPYFDGALLGPVVLP